MSLQPCAGTRASSPDFDLPLASLLYDRPDDVVADDALTVQEKREILSSWASDAFAVESMPPLRAAPFARTAVAIDDILKALASLDGARAG
jgi:hypothetical protein